MESRDNQEALTKEIIFILFSQKNVIFCTFILVCFIAIFIFIFATRQYISESTILIKAKQIAFSPEFLELERSSQEITDINKEDMNAELEVLTSEAVIQLSAKKLLAEGFSFEDIQTNGRDYPSSNVTKIHGTELTANESDYIKPYQLNAVENLPLSKLTQKISSALEASISPSSSVIRMKLHWENPDDARKILEQVFNSFLEYRQNLYNPDQVAQFYNAELSILESQIESNRSKLIEITETNKSPSPASEIESNLNLKKDLLVELRNLEIEKIKVDEDKLNITTAINTRDNYHFSFIENRTIQDLILRLQQLDIERYKFKAGSQAGEDSLQRYNWAYKNLLKEIKGIEKKLTSDLRSLTEKINLIENKISDIDQRNLSLNKMAIDIEKLETEHSLLKNAYMSAFKRKEEVGFGTRRGEADLRTQVIQLMPPSLAYEPMFPNPYRFFPVSLILALIVALTIGFLNEYLDTSFKRNKDCIEQLGIPTLISIPILNTTK